MDADLISYESMIAAQKAAEWAYWSMIGTWLAGFATFAAVITSLCIARMRPKPRIKGEVNLITLRKLGWKKVVGIKISNVGPMAVSIVSIVWQFERDKIFLYDFAPESQNLPLKLEHGEAGFFFINNDQQSSMGREVKQFILENNGEIAKLRIAVHLGTMDSFYIKPAKAVLEMINNS